MEEQHRAIKMNKCDALQSSIRELNDVVGQRSSSTNCSSSTKGSKSSSAYVVRSGSYRLIRNM